MNNVTFHDPATDGPHGWWAKLHRWAHDHGLSLVLAGLWLVFIAVMWLTHDGGIVEWLNAVAENQQSEAWQVLLTVLLTKWLIEKGSHESKDSAERHARETTSQHLGHTVRLQMMDRKVVELQAAVAGLSGVKSAANQQALWDAIQLLDYIADSAPPEDVATLNPTKLRHIAAQLRTLRG